jgi:hypothetical protein
LGEKSDSRDWVFLIMPFRSQLIGVLYRPREENQLGKTPVR